MKSGLVLSVVLLAVVIGFGLWSESAVIRQSDRYISASQELLTLTMDEQWEHAAKVADDYNGHLRSIVPWMCTLINHDEVELLSSALCDLRSAILAQNTSDSARACYQLKSAAERIKERNRLTPENIL